MPWRTITGDELAPPETPQLEVLFKGAFNKQRFLELVRYFIVFEDEGGGKLTKKMAGYHQFHAVNVAVEETLRAARLRTAAVAQERGRYDAGRRRGGEPGDRRIGVVWHTQGSGKSLTMVFYARRIAREPAMKNPTIVVLTDRNDLDDQLFGTFARCQEALRQPPVQTESREQLRKLLSVESGGLIFTTIQKFFPESKGKRHQTISDRWNIVVIADEAHRSQYDFIDGFARHMRDALPRASFIGFTGTPVEKEDANTRAVFGDYISIYDFERAVDDGATVPIYYESRLVKLALPEEMKPKVDEQFDEVTEKEEVERKEKLKGRWAQLEAIVGVDERLRTIAEDIVNHFERRLESLRGKAMIVCMSRRICVKLYDEIIKLRPQWASDDDEAGEIKVVMTGSAADSLAWQKHIRNKQRREILARRFRDPQDPLKIVIVRDMWLTGFDCPCLHTMYIDKPMRGHNLMQTITRLNRVFRDKPGGLVVDYFGLAAELKEAIAVYTESGGQGQPVLEIGLALKVMEEKYDICRGIMYGFDWEDWKSGDEKARLDILLAAQEHILSLPNGKERFVNAVRDLSKVYALVGAHEEARKICDDLIFFQSVSASLTKRAAKNLKDEAEIDYEISQIVSRAIFSQGVVDLLEAAGLKKPDISILSEEFLAEVRGLEYKNVAVELLQKLIKGEIRKKLNRNVVQNRRFSEMLERAVRLYQNRAIEAKEVIEELIEIARQLRAAALRGEKLDLSEDELAFYDALAENESAVEVLGDDVLRKIARELVKTLKQNITIDWKNRENVRAQLRVLTKRILRRYGYPPDKQEKATTTVLEQVETLSDFWLYEVQS